MADTESTDLESVSGFEGQVTVDIGMTPNELTENQRKNLLSIFAQVGIRVTNQNGDVVGRIEVAECRVCGALVRKNRGALLTHGLKHQRERRAR